MIRVLFNPAELEDPEKKEWWRRWQRRADDATDEAIDAFEDWLSISSGEPFRFHFKSAIWKDLKDWLMGNVFYDRCAYCERSISGYYGDAEHFRPKGAVTRKDGNDDVVEAFCQLRHPVTGNDVQILHPGYFWLAYDWRNLVPSCVYCNSGQGKNERFDTENGYILMLELCDDEVLAMPEEVRPRRSKRWPGHYYPSPPILDAWEVPLFLNPLNPADGRNPRAHIRFGQRGTVAAVKDSKYAPCSIEVFGLKKEKITRARQKAQELFRSTYFDALREFDPATGTSKAQALLDEYAAGMHPFSAAALDYHAILYFAQPKPV